MPKWQDFYKPPQIDWDALEDWWPWEENLNEVRAFYEQLLRDVPKQVIEDGLDQIERHADPKCEELGHWRRGAVILTLGELEAAVEGPPESMTELWARRHTEISELMEGVIAEEAIEDPAAELSAAWYAQNAVTLLDQIKRYTSIAAAGADEHDDDPEARVWMREIISEAVVMAFHAGFSVRAASTKKFDPHALRGIKIIRAAQSGGSARERGDEGKRLAHMDDIYKRTKNVSFAARSAAKIFPQSSVESNRRLYYRARSRSVARP